MQKVFFARKKSGEMRDIYDLPNKYRKKRGTSPSRNTGKCVDSGKVTHVGTLVVYWLRQVREYVQPVAGVKKITQTAINEALRKMKKAGIDKPELEEFFGS